jgi:AcrR family transcriptional regulator
LAKNPTASSKLVKAKKRTRRDPDSSRKLILDATEKIMLEDGYASVTTRRVAAVVHPITRN